MDQERVYGVTRQGKVELTDSSTSLTAAELKLLVLVDGSTTVAQIAKFVQEPAPEAVVKTLEKLAASGYIIPTIEMTSGRGIDAGVLFGDSDAGLASLRASGYIVRIAQRAPDRPKLAAGEKITVLVVENDPQLVKMLRTYLKMEDFAARFAATRDEITAALREPPKPDVVLLEAVLPDIDGFDVLAKMRHHDALKSVPVIMVTVKATREAVLTGLLRGANGYVTKPYDMPVLLKAVRSVLGLPKVVDTSWSGPA